MRSVMRLMMAWCVIGSLCVLNGCGGAPDPVEPTAETQPIPTNDDGQAEAAAGAK